DALLLLLAGLGGSVIVLTVPVLLVVIFFVGIIFLLYMGWSIWNNDLAALDKKDAALSIMQRMLFAMSASLLNPHTVLDTIGVIGTSSLSYAGGEKVLFTTSCIAVSCLWFIGLAVAGRTVGNFDTEGKLLGGINKISALIIWGVAIYLGIQLYDG